MNRESIVEYVKNNYKLFIKNIRFVSDSEAINNFTISDILPDVGDYNILGNSLTSVEYQMDEGNNYMYYSFPADLDARSDLKMIVLIEEDNEINIDYVLIAEDITEEELTTCVEDMNYEVNEFAVNYIIKDEE